MQFQSGKVTAICQKEKKRYIPGFESDRKLRKGEKKIHSGILK